MYLVQKKRKNGWKLLILFLCAFLVGLGIGALSKFLRPKPEPAMPGKQPRVAREEVEEPAPSDAPASGRAIVLDAEQNEDKKTYYVVAKDERVCVFIMDREGIWRFSHNLAIELDALRKEDQELFYEGITVHSKEELSSLIEDFSS